MGKPKKVQAVKVGENYNWGGFGSANAQGVNFNPTVQGNIATAQSGTQRYLNELLNPSYNNASFKARQDILDASNQQYANQMGANAIDRGARGSATQNILNSIAANRNNDMRSAMTQEDQRVANILNASQGVENNYFNQANAMSGNIMQRVLANQQAQNAANMQNAAARNQWSQGLMKAGLGIGGALLGGALAPAATTFGGAVDNSGMYGAGTY